MARWKPLPEELDPEIREFASQLRGVIDRSGLSLAAVADRTGYSKSSWERYLNGRLLPPRGATRALADVTETDVRHLGTMWELAERAWSRSEMRHDVTMEAIQVAQARAALGEAPDQSRKGKKRSRSKERPQREKETPGAADGRGDAPAAAAPANGALLPGQDPGRRPSPAPADRGSAPTGPDAPARAADAEAPRPAPASTPAPAPTPAPAAGQVDDRTTVLRRSDLLGATRREPDGGSAGSGGEPGAGDLATTRLIRGRPGSGGGAGPAASQGAEPGGEAESASPWPRAQQRGEPAGQRDPWGQRGQTGQGPQRVDVTSWGREREAWEAKMADPRGSAETEPAAETRALPAQSAVPPAQSAAPAEGSSAAPGHRGEPGVADRPRPADGAEGSGALPPAPAAAGSPAGPAGNGRRSGKRGVKALAGIVGALVVVAAAFLVLDLGGGSDETDASPTPSESRADLPSGVKCRGDQCAGEDPEDMGCGGQYAKTSASGVAGGSQVEVRYSKVCQAAWARVQTAEQGDSLTVTAGGESETETVEATNDTYTAMVPVESGSQARACVELASGGRGCTERR